MVNSVKIDRKMGLNKYILIGCGILLLGCTSVKATGDNINSVGLVLGKDSVAVTKFKTEEEDIKSRVNFNAMNYVHQKRYRPDYSMFSNKKFADNLYVGVFGGLSSLLHRNNAEMNMGGEAGVYATKYILPWTGVRISVFGKSNRRLHDNEDWKTLGINVDHLFNLSTYMDGFNPYRRFEILTVAGFGVDRSSIAGNSALALDAHVGLQMKINTNSRLDLLLEPRIGVFSDNIDLSGTSNWRKYDIGYDFVIGAQYRLGRAYDRIKSLDKKNEQSFWERAFIGLSVGPNLQLSEMTKEIGIKNALGTSLSASLGVWVSEPLGIRLSAFASYDGWRRVDDSPFDRLAAYGGGRAELMLDPMAIFTQDREKYKFSVTPFAGMEFGLAMKQDAQIRKATYAGFTGGLQLKYRLQNGLGVYMEPRYSLVPYSFFRKNIMGENEQYKFADNMLSLGFGLEFYQRSFSDKTASKVNDAFVPYFTVSTGVGFDFAIQQSRNRTRRIGYLAGASLAYKFNPISGLRLTGETGLVYSRMPKQTSQNVILASLDYVLDMTSVTNGYDKERKWDAEIFAGPVLLATNASKNLGRFYFGLEGGGRLTYNATQNLGVYAEPKARLFTKRVFPVGSGTPLVAGMSMGVSYKFSFNNEYYADGLERNFFDDIFVGMNMGAVNSYAALVNAGGRSFVNSMGPLFNLYVGKWLTPFWGVKAGGLASFYSNALMGGKNPDRMTAYAAATFEGMFNPFRLKGSEQRFIFELVPTGGVQIGEVWRHMGGGRVHRSLYTALTAALQVRYNASENMALILEPRVARAAYNIPDGEAQTGAKDNLLSISFGVEFTKPGFVDKTESAAGFIPYMFASLGLGGASQIAVERYENLCMGLGLAADFGYKATPFSAFRFSVDYDRLKVKHETADNKKNNFATIGIDYMWDVSNTFIGYDESRGVGLELFVGPFCSFSKFDEDKKARFGVQAGARMYVPVKDNIEVFVQPKAKIYGKGYLPAVYRQRSPFLFSVALGASYRFNL